MFDEKDVEKFQEIYRGYYGKEINKTDAHRELTNLLTMITILAEELVWEKLKNNENELKERAKKFLDENKLPQVGNI